MAGVFAAEVVIGTGLLVVVVLLALLLALLS